jgi:hypothetical protein
MAPQAQGLTIGGAGGNGHVQGAAVLEGNALLAPQDRLLEVDLQARAHVGTLGGESPAWTWPGAPARTCTPRPATEHLPKDVAEVRTLKAACATAEWTALSRPAAKAPESLAPVGIDLPGVELRALLDVAEDVEGGFLASLRKAFRMSSAPAPRGTPSTW